MSKIIKIIMPYVYLVLIPGCAGILPHTPKALKPEKNNPKAMEHFITAKFFELKENTYASIVELTEALKYDSTSPTIYRQLARNYYSLGKMEDAVIYSIKAVKADPSSYANHLALSSLYQRQRNTALAAVELEAAFKLMMPQPNNVKEYIDIFAAAVSQYLKLDNKKKVLELAEILQKKLPQSEPAQLKAALAYSVVGQSKKAKSIFKNLLFLNPASEDAALGLGMILESENKEDEAIKIYEETALRNPAAWTVMKRLGYIFMLRKRWKDAIPQFQKALRIVPDDQSCYQNLTVLYYYIGEIDSSKQFVDTILKKKTNDSEFFKYLSGMFVERREFDLATEMLRKAVEKLDGDSNISEAEKAEIYDSLGRFLSLRGEKKEAVEVCRKAVLLAPNNVDILFGLASNLEQADFFEEAVQTFEKLLNIDPENALALNYLGYLFADRNIRLEEARQMIEKAVSKDPENGAFLDSLGWIYYRLGKLEEAEFYLDEAIRQSDQVGPEKAVIHDHLGDVAKSLGKLKKAKDQWRKSLELDPNSEKVKEKLRDFGK